MCWVTELRCCRDVNVILYVSWTSQGSTLLCFSYCLYTLTAEAFTSATIKKTCSNLVLQTFVHQRLQEPRVILKVEEFRS